MESFIQDYFILFIPLIVLYYGLVIYCIIDLFKADRTVRGGNKILWLLIILLASSFGPIIYLIAGRGE